MRGTRCSWTNPSASTACSPIFSRRKCDSMPLAAAESKKNRMRKPKAPLLPLVLVSTAAVGFEIALTRYFAVASWSEYGYWVISIAMVGYSFSGVILSLVRGAALKRAGTLLAVIPLLMMVAAALGYYFTTLNPFNPLELQNQVLWKSQLINIGKFY